MHTSIVSRGGCEDAGGNFGGFWSGLGRLNQENSKN